MKKFFSANNDIQKLYGKIIIVFFLSHIFFTLIFIPLKVFTLFIYNIFSVFFYMGLYFLVRRNHFRSVVSLVHFEISLFAIISTIILGWNLGFPIYLIALTTLVYFCPFKRKYIPYVFSFIEIIAFSLLKVYTLHNSPITVVSLHAASSFYLFNSTGCFAAMLYAAFLSKVSATTTEQTLTKDNSRLKEMVDHDALTHFWSRPYFTENFYKIQERGNNIALVMTDIDDFKNINDTYGHDCGDYILSELANMLRSMCPERSGICRWGGEEFVIIFYGYHLDQIVPLVEQMRRKIANSMFYYQKNYLHITMTFGLSYSIESQNLQELFRLADERMYHGKRNGKNVLITSDNIPE